MFIVKQETAQHETLYFFFKIDSIAMCRRKFEKLRYKSKYNELYFYKSGKLHESVLQKTLAAL